MVTLIMLCFAGGAFVFTIWVQVEIFVLPKFRERRMRAAIANQMPYPAEWIINIVKPSDPA